MGQQAIRGALQSQLISACGWADQTAWERRPFQPTTGVPFQRVNTIFAEPNSYGLGPGALERGVFQVTLCFPANTGIAESTARAEEIRAAFPKNLVLGGVVKVARKAEITELGTDGDRDLTVVRVRFVER